MNAIDFKVKSEIVDRRFPGVDGFWIVGLDIGYSGVNAVCPNKFFCFPSYAKAVPDERISFREPKETDIMFRMDDEIWYVGDIAYREAVASELMDTESELYGRDRYFSSIFKVVSLTGIALALTENEYGSPKGSKVLIQMGLPVKYMDDARYVKEALSGQHIFDIKTGGGPWMHFELSLGAENFPGFIPQPMASMLSAFTDAEGRRTQEGREYLADGKSIFILDTGFGTLDTVDIINGQLRVSAANTYSELGMREVFQKTREYIKKNYNMEVDIPTLQNYLDRGTIKVFDRTNRKSRIVDFTSILSDNCTKVFNSMIGKLDSAYEGMGRYDCIIASGGTYEAWKELLAHEYRNMEGLKIIPANYNDSSLSNTYSVSRGYYFYAVQVALSMQG